MLETSLVEGDTVNDERQFLVGEGRAEGFLGHRHACGLSGRIQRSFVLESNVEYSVLV